MAHAIMTLTGIAIAAQVVSALYSGIAARGERLASLRGTYKVARRGAK